MQINKLDTKKKQAIAKVMLDLNYSSSKIAEELGVDRSTVYRYGQKEIGDDLQQFATEIKTMFALNNLRLLAKIVKCIEGKMRLSSLRDLIKAYSVIKSHTPSLYNIHKDSEREKRWKQLNV